MPSGASDSRRRALQRRRASSSCWTGMATSWRRGDEPINYDAGAIPRPEFLAVVRAETLGGGSSSSSTRSSPLPHGPDCARATTGAPISAPLAKHRRRVPYRSSGRRELMVCLSAGQAIHTGTYNAKPIPVLAAHAFLDTIADPASTRTCSDPRAPLLCSGECLPRAGLPVASREWGALRAVLRARPGDAGDPLPPGGATRPGQAPRVLPGDARAQRLRQPGLASRLERRSYPGAVDRIVEKAARAPRQSPEPDSWWATWQRRGEASLGETSAHRDLPPRWLRAGLLLPLLTFGCCSKTV